MGTLSRICSTSFVGGLQSNLTEVLSTNFVGGLNTNSLGQQAGKSDVCDRQDVMEATGVGRRAGDEAGLSGARFSGGALLAAFLCWRRPRLGGRASAQRRSDVR